MEAVQLFREEQVKLAEHREQCTAARKEVGALGVASRRWSVLSSLYPFTDCDFKSPYSSPFPLPIQS